MSFDGSCNISMGEATSPVAKISGRSEAMRDAWLSQSRGRWQAESGSVPENRCRLTGAIPSPLPPLEMDLT